MKGAIFMQRKFLEDLGLEKNAPLTHRSKLYIACSAFLQKSELTHAAAPPFRKKSRSARLLGCKRPRCGSLSLTTFCAHPPNNSHPTLFSLSVKQS